MAIHKIKRIFAPFELAAGIYKDAGPDSKPHLEDVKLHGVVQTVKVGSTQFVLERNTTLDVKAKDKNEVAVLDAEDIRGKHVILHPDGGVSLRNNLHAAQPVSLDV